MGSVAIALIVGALFTNCAGPIDQDSVAATSFVDPATYLYYTCPQLATARAEVGQRKRELEQLIIQAERGAGGALVSSLVYRSQHTEALGRLKLIDDAARERNCAPGSVPPSPAPTAAPTGSR